MKDSVEICECGHLKEKHWKDKKGRPGICGEYIYNTFEDKCRCDCYRPYMTIDKETYSTDICAESEYSDEFSETL